MIYSVLITHERNPDVFVATIPAFDLVTQGSSKQAAIRAAKEAIVLELRGRAHDREPSLIEPDNYADLVRVQIDPEVDPAVPIAAPSGSIRDAGGKRARGAVQSAAAVIGRQRLAE